MARKRERIDDLIDTHVWLRRQEARLATHDELWAGPELKLGYAHYHLVKMQLAITPPQGDSHIAAMQAAGVLVDTGWQRAIGPYFDAFLSAARSIPEIIACCFGRDTPNKEMKLWFDGLPSAEQDRRKQFTQEFKSTRKAFSNLPLTKTRNVAVHRRGYAPYKVRIAGRFGVTHEGGPTKVIPLSEAPTIFDPNFPPGLARQWPIEPNYTDVTIDDRPLFDACQEYLNEAARVIGNGRAISTQILGANVLTPPPDA